MLDLNQENVMFLAQKSVHYMYSINSRTVLYLQYKL